MENKHMKRWSTWSPTKQMKTKSTMKLSLHTYQEWVKWKITIPKLARMQRNCITRITLRACKMVQPLWKTIRHFLIKLHMQLPYNPAIIFLNIYPREMKILVPTNTCAWMFTEALFVIPQDWNQPRCPSIGKRLTVPHTYLGILLSSKKRQTINT